MKRRIWKRRKDGVKQRYRVGRKKARATFYHNKGKIKIENRPPKPGFEEFADEEQIKRTLSIVPKEDLPLIKKIRSIPHDSKDSTRGAVDYKKPREIMLFHKKKGERFIPVSSPTKVLLHELGHISRGHVSKESKQAGFQKLYDEDIQFHIGAEKEADWYAEQVLKEARKKK